MASWGRKMPPCLYIDMPKDTGMAPKVAANIVALKAHGSAVAEIQVGGWGCPLAATGLQCSTGAGVAPPR